MEMHLQTVPIPGSAKPHRIQENVDAANMSLTSEAYKEIQEILNSMPPSGGRYPETRSGALVSRFPLWKSDWVQLEMRRGTTANAKYRCCENLQRQNGSAMS